MSYKKQELKPSRAHGFTPSFCWGPYCSCFCFLCCGFFLFLFLFCSVCLRLVCPMLAVSLDSWLPLSDFSNIYCNDVVLISRILFSFLHRCHLSVIINLCIWISLNTADQSTQMMIIHAHVQTHHMNATSHTKYNFPINKNRCSRKSYQNEDTIRLEISSLKLYKNRNAKLKHQY